MTWDKPDQTPPPHLDRAVVLAASVAALREYRVLLRCRCKIADLPLKVPAQDRRLRMLTIADFLVRQRCQKCGPLAGASLVADDYGRPSGMGGRFPDPPGWRIDLIGDGGR